MKYIVMECHPGFAVVLDEEGRFFKVANMHYQVGQTVENVIEMNEIKPSSNKVNKKKWLYSMAALAACMVITVSSLLYIGQPAYATVHITINPDVCIEVNKNDVVVGLKSENSDGENLIKDYSYKKKDLNIVMNELLKRAIDMKYLNEGAQIILTLDADDNQWIISHSKSLGDELAQYLSQKVSVSVDIKDSDDEIYNQFNIDDDDEDDDTDDIDDDNEDDSDDDDNDVADDENDIDDADDYNDDNDDQDDSNDDNDDIEDIDDELDN